MNQHETHLVHYGVLHASHCVSLTGSRTVSSQAHVLYTMAKNAEGLEAFKTARFAYNKLQTLKMPADWHDQIDLACITTRAKPFSDAEEQLPVCYRCGTVNPLVNSQGDVCINCGAGFLRSFVTFDHLPLVEFELEGGVSDAEAMGLLEAVPPKDGVLQRGGAHKGGGSGRNRGGVSGGSQRANGEAVVATAGDVCAFSSYVLADVRTAGRVYAGRR